MARKMVPLRIEETDLDAIDQAAIAAGKSRTHYMTDKSLDRETAPPRVAKGVISEARKVPDVTPRFKGKQR